MSRALCGGYVVLDVVHCTWGVRRAAGGTAANIAANLCYLGWESEITARIGDDSAGKAVVADLRAVGVAVDGLWLDADTVTPLIEHSSRDGVPRYRYGCSECRRGVAVYRPLPEEAASEVLSAGLRDVFVFDRPCRFNAAVAEAHRTGGRQVVYEPATKASPGAHRRACAAATIVKISRPDRETIGDRLPPTAEGEVRITTDGAEGATLELNGVCRRVSPPRVSAVDAGGAGDWLTAAIVHRLASGSGPMDALDWAQAVAAMSTLYPGARGMSSSISRSAMYQRAGRIRRGMSVQTGDVATSSRRARRGSCPRCGLALPRNRS
ncbi:carbohydrate kinase family protein [Candidatus Poriferisodalis sp.]|uniref:carbohydrate kinase family protein n=1 Tax=Candidatus Poriferisodalis sp. TaxID=3101277 RepID=UPI003B02DACF